MKLLRGLWVVLAAGVVLADEPTNLVEVLRNFQKQLDADKHAAGAVEARRPAAKPPQQSPRVEAPAVAAETLAPVAPAAVSVAVPPAPVADPDTIVAGDALAVEVVDEPDLSVARAVVSTEGTIQCPMLGTLAVGGKTAVQVAESVRAALAKDYLVDPKVNVRLHERERCSFTILLNVAKPGTYVWARKENMTLLRAIGMAGGATRAAVLSKISVQRKVDGKQQVLQVDLDAMNRDRTAAPFQVLPGDVIEVGGR